VARTAGSGSGIGGHTFPTAAQGLVKYDELDGGHLLGDDNHFLDLVLLTLGVQDVKEIGQATVASASARRTSFSRLSAVAKNAS